MPASDALRALLVEILTDTDRIDKLSVMADPTSRTVMIVYEDMDDEWFKEVHALVQTKWLTHAR